MNLPCPKGPRGLTGNSKQNSRRQQKSKKGCSNVEERKRSVVDSLISAECDRQALSTCHCGQTGVLVVWSSRRHDLNQEAVEKRRELFLNMIDDNGDF